MLSLLSKIHNSRKVYFAGKKTKARYRTKWIKFTFIRRAILWLDFVSILLYSITTTHTKWSKTILGLHEFRKKDVELVPTWFFCQSKIFSQVWNYYKYLSLFSFRCISRKYYRDYLTHFQKASATWHFYWLKLAFSCWGIIYSMYYNIICWLHFYYMHAMAYRDFL